MGYIVQVNNKTKEKIPQKDVEAVLRKTVELALGNFFAGKRIELSVALVGEAEICLLNNQYRKKNHPTDVLSFAESENFNKLSLKDSASIIVNDIFIGELIVCPAYIKKNAIEDGENFDYAMKYIISHGILHLLGFSHGKKMFSLQHEVAQQLSH